MSGLPARVLNGPIKAHPLLVESLPGVLCSSLFLFFYLSVSTRLAAYAHWANKAFLLDLIDRESEFLLTNFGNIFAFLWYKEKSDLIIFMYLRASVYYIFYILSIYMEEIHFFKRIKQDSYKCRKGKFLFRQFFRIINYYFSHYDW